MTGGQGAGGGTNGPPRAYQFFAKFSAAPRCRR
jgi:hypothetical protein